MVDMKRIDVDRDYGVAPPGYRLPAETHVGRIRLQVSNLDRSVRYYREVLGFDARVVDAGMALLAARDSTEYLIELRHIPGTTAVPSMGVLGLYHFAILLPSRELLGGFVSHLLDRRVQFGSADHLVSEATYLWDPDGLGIEVYADRPRDAWRTNGRELVMTTDRLDLRSLAEAGGATPWTGMPAGTTIGHMHLSVGDLAAARDFYHSALGFETMVWSYPGALFMSAGGYHHHLATNTWAAGARVAEAHDAKLLEWELVLPTAADIAAAAASLRDAGHAVSERRTSGVGFSPGGLHQPADLDQIVTDPWKVSLRLRAAQTPDTLTAPPDHPPPR
jgi:catechol 2,3-dioxygenase